MSTAPPPADPALLARIQEETGVETEVSPALTDYALHLRERAWAAVEALLDQGDLTETAQVVGLWVVGGLIPAILLFLGLRALWRRRRHDAPRALEVGGPDGEGATGGAPADRVAAALARGDGRGALGAAWEGMAAALGAAGLGPYGPEQTEREFEAGVRRRSPDWSGLDELRALRRAVVIGLYGPGEPPLAEVEALVARSRRLAEAGVSHGVRGGVAAAGHARG